MSHINRARRSRHHATHRPTARGSLCTAADGRATADRGPALHPLHPPAVTALARHGSVGRSIVVVCWSLAPAPKLVPFRLRRPFVRLSRWLTHARVRTFRAPTHPHAHASVLQSRGYTAPVLPFDRERAACSKLYSCASSSFAVGGSRGSCRIAAVAMPHRRRSVFCSRMTGRAPASSPHKRPSRTPSCHTHTQKVCHRGCKPSSLTSSSFVGRGS